MFVGDRMSSPAITVAPDTSFQAALQQMRNHGFRRLPVVGEKGSLVGIVSERDLLHAAPSSATSLSIWEVQYLLCTIQIGEIMTKDIITVTADTPLEEAARIMADDKIGGLPVMENGRLVGIITETDIFKVFLELLGARQEGLRLTLEIPERKGEMARITTAIARLGGNILALGTFLGDDPTTAVITVKVEDVPIDMLDAAMQDLDLYVLDAREA